MALTTLAEVKNYLGVNTAAFDGRYDALRGAAEAIVEKWCRRKFKSTAYADFLDGGGTRFLTLRHRPVTAVTEVAQANRGSYGQSGIVTYDVLQRGLDWALQYRSDRQADDPVSRTAVLVRLTGTWPEHPGFARSGVLSWEREAGLGNIRVKYTAGFDDCPADVKYAVAELCGYMFRTAKRGGMEFSERLGDHSYMVPMARIKQAPELAAVRQILSQYREVSW